MKGTARGERDDLVVALGDGVLAALGGGVVPVALGGGVLPVDLVGGVPRGELYIVYLGMLGAWPCGKRGGKKFGLGIG